MKFNKRNALPALLPLAILSCQSWADSNSSESSKEEYSLVYGEQENSDTATKLELSVSDTPQNITTISLGQIQDFGLFKINDVLDYATGVTVEEIETTRTYYTARGFDIVNFKYDGVGAPFISGINRGQQDSALYEKVQVIKGASGLISGVGNPSATINFERKRPTESFQGSAAFTAGEWQQYRSELDVSGSLSSSIRARGVAVVEDNESYLDRYTNETLLGYGIFEFDLSDSTLLTISHSIDKFEANGVLWGALPLIYSDGSATDYAVSTNNAPDWTFNDVTEQQTFAELSQEITENWNLDIIATYRDVEYDAKLFYVYGTPDPETELGLYGWSGAHTNDMEEVNLEFFFTGDIQFGGQSHQLVFGYSYFDADQRAASYSNSVTGYPVLGADWAEGNTPDMDFPEHDPATQAGDVNLKQKSFYFASRWNLLDNLSVLLGARTNDFEQSGLSYGGVQDAESDETTPYVGFAWEFIDTFTLYSSYSEVFSPQTFVSEDLTPIGPVNGSSSEIGFKKSFNDGSAYLTAGYFKSELSNFGEFIGRNDDGIALYDTAEYENTGYEIEFAGEIAEGLNLAAGFTQIDIKDPNGNDSRVFLPRKTFDISGSYVLPSFPKLKLGAAAKWQDDIETTDGLAKQDSYSVIDLAAFYSVTEDIVVSVKVDNVGDKKYLNSLYWSQAYYAAPRQVSASIRWTF